MTGKGVAPEVSRDLGGSTVKVEDVTVDFGSFRALNSVSVTFEPGRVHSVLGQNGAGKTTLARSLLGLISPSGGSIEVGGLRIDGRGVPVARSAGIDMVHQSFTLPPSMSVAEALEFFQPSRTGIRPYRKAVIYDRWRQILSDLDVSVDPSVTIGSLPVQTVQALEIARALVADAKVLILDEPTSNIAPQHAAALFARVRALAKSGLTILVILHKVREVLAVADTVTVLREGTCVLSAQPADDFTELTLSQAIIGERKGTAVHVVAPDRVISREGVPVLELTEAHSDRMAGDGDAALQGASLDVLPGSIVGVAGVEGNGQVTLVNCVLGLRSIATGCIAMSGIDMTRCDVGKRRRSGLRAIPFDRLTEGVSASRTIWENVAAGWLTSGAHRSPFIRPSRLKSEVLRVLTTWRVAYRSLTQQVSELSGGNIQRIVFAREVDADVRCLVAAQPTRGLDIQATSFVHDTLRDLRNQGVGVMLVSSDLDELFSLSDVVYVIRSGVLTDRFEAPFDLSSVGAAMVGAS